MINDNIVCMQAPEVKDNLDKDEIINFLFNKRKEIEETFPNDEYIKLDLTHGEVIGLKSSSYIPAEIVGMKEDLKIGDLTAINWVISKSEKYKDADIINLGNVNMLYENLVKR